MVHVLMTQLMLFALAVLVMPCRVAFAQTETPTPQEDAVLAAASQYLASQAVSIPTELSIQWMDESYARVIVKARDGSTDPALMILRHDDQGWHEITMGSAFSPESMEELGLPERSYGYPPPPH